MSQARATGSLLVAAAILAMSVMAAAEPLFTLTDDGRTFLYRARPGDHPALVAEMFGIPAHDLPAFLAANGITDPTRVGAGFTYHIPNAAVRALTERDAALEHDNTALRHSAAEQAERSKSMSSAADEARATAAQAERRVQQLERLEQLWPWARLAIVVLVLALVGAAYTALAAIRRQAQADRWARGLAREAEEKRKGALAERQESAKRILDLEARIRTLEAQLGPRVVIGGRSGS
jgi:hypothetical protein